MLKYKYKFSIVIPIFNCEKYLSKCIDSIIGQKFDDYELILVDDGSTDKSSEICDKYAKNKHNIKVIHKENGGTASSRNIGLKNSLGEYVLFVDSDDYVAKDYFTILNDELKKYPNMDLYNFGFYSEIVDKDYNVIQQDKINFKNKKYNSRDEIRKDLVELYDRHIIYNPVNRIYRRDIIEKNNISFPLQVQGEDIEFNREYLLSINNMVVSNSCIYHYVRERSDSVTRKYDENFFDLRKQQFYEFNDYFAKWDIREKEYIEFSSRRYLERVLGCIENEFCSNLKFPQKYNNIKQMINDKLTRRTLKYIKPRSTKVKIMLIPIRLKLTLLTMLMGWTIFKVRSANPALFNKLKNRR